MTPPDPHVDASRGCAALERGPLVYCIETADLPDGLVLEEVELDPAAKPAPVARPDVGQDVVGLAVPATRRGDGPVEIGAVPYLAWANRTVEAMRVWIPRASSSIIVGDDGDASAGAPTAGRGSDGHDRLDGRPG